MLPPRMGTSGDSDASEQQQIGTESASRDGRWLGDWLLHGRNEKHSQKATAPWWQVMCLTGVDYF